MEPEEPQHYEVPDGCYFMLGDNRNYSNDARRWTHKYVKRDKLVAKVLFQYFPKIQKLNYPIFTLGRNKEHHEESSKVWRKFPRQRKTVQKVGDIIRADKSRRYVVPSAPGKRNKNDTKVTDMLYACYEAASTGASYGKLLSAIKERYEQIIDGLELNLNLDYEFKTIEENFIAKKGSDYAASRGEYLNGIIMSHYLGYEFIDAAEVIFFDENGTFLSEKTNEELAERLAHTERAVIPGFYGSNPDGTIHTFSRGGSDITRVSMRTSARFTQTSTRTGPMFPVSW